ncbi:MAG: DUF6476 family protein [Devosiaceae bacterium]|nr:DUF6476 family protein [Devosiaceae bacterium]
MTNSDPYKNEQTSEMNDETFKVIGKAKRSFGFSMAILILGLMAIVLALVYRSTREEESAANRFSLQEIIIPAGAQILSVVPMNDVIIVTYQKNGDATMRILDIVTGETMKEVPVVEEAPVE